MKKCVLVIGHKQASQGASNELSGLTEFAFNNALAIDIQQAVTEVDVQLVYRQSYSKLPEDINQLNSDFIISLHCNAFNRSASGTEVLYYYKSVTGKLFAEVLQEQLVATLGLPNRGVKPKASEDRGGYLLRYTSAPCVISEPFFIDNNYDLDVAINNRERLIDAYAQCIESIAGML